MAKENSSKITPGGFTEKFSTRREAIRATRVGGETPDPTPVEIPVTSQRPLTLREEMMRFIRTEMSQQARQDGEETFEEFDDLDVDDEEPDFTTGYTVQELTDEEGAYLLEPEPESAVQESDQNFIPEEPSEARGAEGAEPAGRNTEPREVDKQSSRDID